MTKAMVLLTGGLVQLADRLARGSSADPWLEEYRCDQYLALMMDFVQTGPRLVSRYPDPTA
jgi:hypothetical protein